jgi:predicted nucleic acid-binding protein
LARISRAQSKSFALIDSNVIVYAVIKDYPIKLYHEKCLSLLEKGLKGELDYILALNPVIVVEVFSALRKLLNCAEAEFKVGSLLSSRRIAFLSISKEACKNAVHWAKERNVPVNDALIAANMVEYAQLIYTSDEEHFGKLEEKGVEILNPTKLGF